MSTIKVKDDLGIKTIKTFYKKLQNAIKKDTEIILDFSNIEYVDLSIIQVLMAAIKEARKKGSIMKLKFVQASVRKQLQIGGLLK